MSIVHRHVYKTVISPQSHIPLAAAAGAHHSVICKHDVVDVEGDGAGAGQSCNIAQSYSISQCRGLTLAQIGEDCNDVYPQRPVLILF